jgi:hypothetical protein
MIKRLLILTIATLAAGCVNDTPPLQITTDHPAHPHAAPAPPAVMSNTLTIEAAPTAAPTSAPTTPEEGAHEHHH